MASTIALNPLATTNAAGSFGVSWDGLIQGTEYNDPAVRNYLAGGILATTETLPMWGGVGISEAVPNNVLPYYGIGTTYPNQSLGGIITRATNVTANTASSLTGFSVFTQNYANVSNPQNQVPVSLSGMLVNFYRIGSGARIAVAMAPALSALVGSVIVNQVSWDFVNQQLIPYIAAYASANVASATYTTATGILSLTFGSAPFGAGIGSGANGVYISISGITTSAGNAANVNGDFAITSTASAGTVINVQAVAGLGTITINSATGVLAAGGGALNVRVLDMNIGNSMTISYSTSTLYANWNRSGSCAVILI
jgi:hypothetical protein